MSTAPTPFSLAALRPCFEGAIPAVMATCGADGTPNVAYISQVFYVDERHVALSFQFFNRTRKNILANPWCNVLVLHPLTAAMHRLQLRYLRTETTGPVFEGMRAQLAGIASHTGMSNVFKLLGADVYEVAGVDDVPGEPLPAPPPAAGQLLAALRHTAERLARCTGTDELLQAVLAALAGPLRVEHGMVLMLDAATERLYTVASLGYARSGIGSEIELGHGVIGMAAAQRTPVRISHMTNAAIYSHAARSSLQRALPGLALATDIPFPGLAEPRSQLAVPVAAAGRLLGVLFVESPQDLRFGFEEEDALVAIAGHLGAALDALREEPAAEADPATVPAAEIAAPGDGGPALEVRRYAVNNSIFLGGEYLIKGVAGAILWKLLRDHQEQGRSDFTNRELRLDASIGLPEVADNLEARLVLLQRRLQESGPHIRIEKTGRGRFALRLARPVLLAEVVA